MADTPETLLDLINETLQNGDFIPHEAAIEIESRWLATDPASYTEWVSASAVRMIDVTLRKALSNSRALASIRAWRDNMERKDFDAITAWRCRIDELGTQRSVMQMTGADHVFVANQYGERASANAMLQAFHSAVARKVGMTKRTCDVLSEEKFLSLYESITGTRDLAMVA